MGRSMTANPPPRASGPSSPRRRSLAGIAAIAMSGPDRAAAQRGMPPAERLIVGFPPGGAIDVVAGVIVRSVALGLGEAFAVSHLAGSSGRIALDALRAAAADGRTLMLASSSMLALGPALRPADWPDPQRAFAPVATVASHAFAANLRPDVPAADVASFVAWARNQAARGQAVHYASHGPGTISHFCGALLDRSFRLGLVHLPFRGGPPARAALEAGHAQLLFDTVGDSLAPRTERRATVIATTSAVRSPFLPDVPTLVEQRVPLGAVEAWLAVIAPAGTPAARIERLSKAIREGVATPEMVTALRGQGLVPQPGDAAALAAAIAEDLAGWARQIRAAGFEPDR